MVVVLKNRGNTAKSKIDSVSKVKTKKISPITKKKSTILATKVSSLRVVHKKPVAAKVVAANNRGIVKAADVKKPVKSSSKIFQNRYIGKSALHHEAIKKIEQIWNIINDYSEGLKSPSKKTNGVKVTKINSPIVKAKSNAKKVAVKKVIAKKVLNNKSNSLVKQLSTKRVK